MSVVLIGDCGVLGIVLKRDPEKLGCYARIALGTLNHRGEDAHGISSSIRGLGSWRPLRALDL